jgi:hypothetical protein
MEYIIIHAQVSADEGGWHRSLGVEMVILEHRRFHHPHHTP